MAVAVAIAVTVAIDILVTHVAKVPVIINTIGHVVYKPFFVLALRLLLFILPTAKWYKERETTTATSSCDCAS